MEHVVSMNPFNPSRREVCVGAAAAAAAGLLATSASAATDGHQLVVPRTQYYDMTSKITGRTYRIMVATPYKADPAKAYPVLYLLDGNAHFRMATDSVSRMAVNGNDTSPAIVVGLGYPTEEIDDVNKQRYLELTPSVSKDPDRVPPGAKTGGGDAFLEAIDKEIKPFVAARYPVDKSHQAFYGHSLGGLTVLRQLFRNPNAFSAYVISSPSIWWNDREILGDEAAFSKRARQHELHLKILITSAGDEQPQTEQGARGRMVDNASELAERLAALDPVNVPVTRVIFPGEVHTSVPASSLMRCIRFAFPREN